MDRPSGHGPGISSRLAVSKLTSSAHRAHSTLGAMITGANVGAVVLIGVPPWNDAVGLTELIRRAGKGDADAADQLFAAMYDDLKRLARSRLFELGEFGRSVGGVYVMRS
jgi:hypothetical protein